MNRLAVDETIHASHEVTGDMAHRLAREEDILLGISSGAAMWAALDVAKHRRQPVVRQSWPSRLIRERDTCQPGFSKSRKEVKNGHT